MCIRDRNTIVHKNGKLKGYNTDYDGFRYMLIKHHIKVSDKKVLILGNGGASAAVQAVIKDADAKELIVVSPSAKNGAISFAEVYAKHRDVQIIINTSPKGMYPHVDEAPIDLQDFPSCEAVLDIIYNPLVTRLGLQAKKYGIPFVGGLEMLVAQAVYAVNYFLDASFTNADIDRLYQKILWEKINIVLIGMPSAGKSSIAKELSKAMQMTYLCLLYTSLRFATHPKRVTFLFTSLRRNSPFVCVLFMLTSFLMTATCFLLKQCIHAFYNIL